MEMMQFLVVSILTEFQEIKRISEMVTNKLEAIFHENKINSLNPDNNLSIKLISNG